MKRQSRRATVLTLLAAFYLPLSLVTGIFGMNIKEFDDVKPSFVRCFEALFAVIAVTMIFYGLYRYLPLVFYPLEESSSVFAIVALLPFRLVWYMFQALEERRKRRPEDSDLENGYDKED
jgi:uncharacterized BrkB/YihY/UPF0761 family membrane protein